MTVSDHSENPAPRAARAARLLWRLARDPAYRHMMRLYWWPQRGAFQPFRDTWPDRYPVIFKFVKSRLPADQAVNLLSFGCATGEEVFSLRRYFPRARIHGIDINPGSVAVARRRLAAAPDAGLSFACGSSTVHEATASYDAIFCMAVLRHGALGRPGVERCDPLLDFDDFARTVADFHRCLKPGGLFVQRHSNFRLRDALAGAHFETLMTVRDGRRTRTPVFGPDNRLMPGVGNAETVFRKLA